MGALYSSMQYEKVAKYFLNKNVHDKLSSNSYLAMQYHTAANFMSRSDIHEQFSYDFFPSLHYVTFINSESVHNIEGHSKHSSELYSSMQYISGINSIRNSDLHEKFPFNTEEAFQYKQTFIPRRDFHSQDISEISPSRDLYSKKQDAEGNKINGKENFEKLSDNWGTVLKFKARMNSYQSNETHDNSMPELCQKDQIVFYASLILHVSNNLTNAQEDLIMLKWSNFISKDPDMIFISRTESDVLGYTGKYILTGGPGNVIESLSKSVEISWHIACGFFEQLHDFTRILQHNIDVGRVSAEIGFNVIAWFVYTDRPLPKRVRRQAHSGKRQTVTPTFSLPAPTTLSEMSTTVTESLLSSFFNGMSSDITSSVIFSSSSSLLPTSVFSVTSLVTTERVFSSVNISFTVPITFTTTYSPGVSSVFTKFVISSPITTFAASKSFSGFSTVFSSLKTSLASFTTPSLLPSFSSSSYLSLKSTSVMHSKSTSFILSTHSYVLSSKSSTEEILLTPSLNSSLYPDTSVPSLSPVFSIESVYTSSFQDISTNFISSFSIVSSSKIESTYFSVTNILETFVTSSSLRSTSILESSLYTSSLSEGIKSISMSVTSNLSASESGKSSSLSSYEMLSSTSSFLLPSYIEIVTTIYSINFSTPFLSSTEIFESLESLTSFVTPLSASALTSLSDTLVSRSSNLPSEFLPYGLSSSSSVFPSLLISSSVLSQASNAAYLSTLAVESDTGIFLSTSLIKSVMTSAFQSSYTVLPSLSSFSKYISFSSTFVLSPTKLITNASIYSISVSTIFPTTVAQPYLTTPVSVTTSSSELFSPKVSSSVLSEMTNTPHKSSIILSSPVVTAATFSSIETSIRVRSTSEIISPLSSIQIFSSFRSSSTVAKESSVYELTPSLPELSTSDMLNSAYSTSKSSVFTTVPSSDRSSVVSTLVLSTSILPSRASVTYSVTSVGSTKVVSTAAPDESPSLEKSIDHLKVIVGRYFKFQIPDGTFSDKEDGNTRNLSLRISLTYSKPFPEDAWLMFNETSQTFYGIPLKNDSDGESVISEFTLIAEDSQGQVAKDAISLTYEYEKDVNHRISVAFNGSYEKFTNDRMNLIKVAEKIADFYNDENLNFLTFSNVETGSVVIVWSNNSLIGTTCIKSKIQELYNRLSDDNGTISDQFVALFTDFTPINTSFEFLGACLLPITSFAPPTKSPVSETDNRMWIEIVLPALIAILVIVIIALLLLICCRHRRPSKEIKDADKPAFLEDRRPIIFPEELEMVDPSLKPKTPLVLPSDYLTETPPAVPPHGRPAPPYRTPMLDEDRFPGEDENPPHLSTYGGHSQQTEPPPYRLPPPYYNPHRMA
ncbi:serine-rich adhesin for platelets-like isoform X1 [Mercenaria mercenaria]|uniref:serine-rich adhesin for platelets-like isoform X1 n=1 Tax=Mercenaria mercenaria TaxID=6596 RepID=UPI00234F06E2|nr:serine-rich adhesin for platelets-like isoform X1 [Mercenaria mercenaria]